MTAFWEKKEFKTYAPYVAAGAVALGGLAYGASEGMLGTDAENFINGTSGTPDASLPPPGVDPTSLGFSFDTPAAAPYGETGVLNAGSSGWEGNLDAALGANPSYQPNTPGAPINDYASQAPNSTETAPRSNSPTTQTRATGGAAAPAAAAVANAGQRGVTGEIWDFVKRNPALLLGAAGMGASILGKEQDKAKKDSTVTTPGSPEDLAKRRQQQLAEWNAIPVTPYQHRRVVSNVTGDPSSTREVRYFERYNTGGEVAGALPVYGMREGGRLRGPGDGMSDSLPAVASNNAGEQRSIHVADGEYVIPADVVSGIGNGSSDAGVRELDALLRRVRQARGVKSGEQPKALVPARVMPA